MSRPQQTVVLFSMQCLLFDALHVLLHPLHIPIVRSGYVPWLHVEHAVAPSLKVNDPNGHCWQAVAESTGL